MPLAAAVPVSTIEIDAVLAPMVRVAPPVVATPATPENVIVPSFAATPDAPLLAKLTSSAPSSNRPLWRAVKVSAAVERPMTAGASSIRFHAVSNAVAMASKLSPALKLTDAAPAVL